MSIRYIVAVCDYNLPDGTFMKTVRRRQFRNLAAARRYEAKFYRKALRKPGPENKQCTGRRHGKIERWGSIVNIGPVWAGWNPARTITITCKVY